MTQVCITMQVIYKKTLNQQSIVYFTPSASFTMAAWSGLDGGTPDHLPLCTAYWFHPTLLLAIPGSRCCADPPACMYMIRLPNHYFRSVIPPSPTFALRRSAAWADP